MIKFYFLVFEICWMKWMTIRVNTTMLCNIVKQKLCIHCIICLRYFYFTRILNPSFIDLFCIFVTLWNCAPWVSWNGSLFFFLKFWNFINLLPNYLNMLKKYFSIFTYFDSWNVGFNFLLSNEKDKFSFQFVKYILSSRWCRLVAE